MLLDPIAIRYWLVVAALALVVAVTVGHAVSRAQHERARWGDTRRVLVASSPLHPGDPLRGAVHAERWPRALVPHGAVAHVGPGARAATDLATGMPLTAAAVGGQPDPGAAPRRTIALAADAAQLPLAPGDVVDLWASVDPALVGKGEVPTRRVATEARVIDADARRVVVAVTPAEVAAVTAGAALDALTVVGRA